MFLNLDKIGLLTRHLIYIMLHIELLSNLKSNCYRAQIEKNSPNNTFSFKYGGLVTRYSFIQINLYL